MKTFAFLSSFILMTTFLLHVEPSVAQTDAECQRLYGETCKDIEKRLQLLRQPTYMQQIIEQERQRQIQSGNGKTVCIKYPGSMSCVASYYDNFNDFVAGHDQYLATEHGRNTSANICYTLRSNKKRGINWKQNGDRAFELSVLNGEAPNTEFEYKLQLWRDLQIINKFCPDLM